MSPAIIGQYNQRNKIGNLSFIDGGVVTYITGKQLSLMTITEMYAVPSLPNENSEENTTHWISNGSEKRALKR